MADRRREVDEPRSIADAVVDATPCHFEGQPGLADAPCTSQRHDPFVFEGLGHLAAVAGTPHESTAALGQVVPLGVGRSERREIGGEVGVAEFEDPLGDGEVLEPVEPEVDERGARREVAVHGAGSRPGGDRLRPVGQRTQPDAPVRDRAVVGPAPDLDDAGVERGPGANAEIGRPRVGGHLALEIDGGGEGGRRVSEDGEAAVALRPRALEYATPALDGRGDDHVVGGEQPQHPLAVQFPQPRRPLDVGEEQGDDAIR